VRASFAVAVLLIAACSGGGGVGGTSGTTVITGVNGATRPVTLTEVLIEIHGTGFGIRMGTVRLFQGGRGLELSSDEEIKHWRDDVIRVVLPEGDATFTFSSPGTVDVSVAEAGSASFSSSFQVEISGRSPFVVTDLAWADATPLPGPLRAHAAVAPRAAAGSAHRAFAVVLGGNDGMDNVADVNTNTIDAQGALGPMWSAAPPLPQARAFHAAALADERNSAVGLNTAHVYVLGGQRTVGSAGTSTVYVARFDTATGVLGAWAETATLPEPLLAARATVLFGYLYLSGGYRASGVASQAVYLARIRSDGTLDPFTRGRDLPLGTAFHGFYAFGGFLFVLMGESGPLTDPFAPVADAATGETWSAPGVDGVVGLWLASRDSTPRSRHVVLPAFKQPILATGLGAAGAELGFANPDGNITQWVDIPVSPGADVFNAAAIVNPLRTPSGAQRHILLGGDSLAAPGTPTAASRRSTSP